MRIRRSALIAIACVSGCAPALFSQALPKCEKAKIQYTTFDETYADRMRILPAKPNAELPLGSKDYSGEKTHWQMSVPPDTRQPGPYTTRIYIGSAANKPDVELVLVDEVNGGVTLRWLNEKLLFGQVWWGRVYSTDFIFDVEQQKFVYREMAHYGAMVEACQ
jgi:hypothetical protein